MVWNRRQLGWWGMLSATAALCGACVSLGLNSAPEQTGPAVQTEDEFAPPGAAPDQHPPQAEGAPEIVVIRMRFDVLRIDLPVDRITHSLKIWNHIDESVGDPALTALLARNGLRLGVAERDAWPAMRTLFEENGGRSTRAERVVQPGLGLTIPLGQVENGDTYFLHCRGGRLQGGTFRAGSKSFQVEYALDEQDPARVFLRVTPQYREKRSKTKLVEQGGEILSVRDHEGVVFDELTATATVEPGQFLVIGSSAEAEKGFLLGSWWLTSRLNMQEYETVLCITPQPVRIE